MQNFLGGKKQAFVRLDNPCIYRRSKGIFILQAIFCPNNLDIPNFFCTFAVDFRYRKHIMLNDAQCPYYQSRSTEAALCEAFPVDEILIRGLRELQVHLQGKGFDINIPRLNVMNAAHRIAAYLFVSDHTAGQIELDAMVYGLARYDRYQALFIQMVLAAILNRTEGARARMYRSIILDDRCEEFNEGVSLYEQFLEHTEKHFCEDDFLIDVAEMVLAIRQQQEQIQQKDEELQQLKQQNKELMENQQRNAPVINVAGNYIDIHDNQHCNIYATEPKSEAPCPTAEQDAPQTGDCSFFGTDKYPADICEKNLREAIDNAKSKADACRNIMTLDSCGYIHIRQLTDAQKAEFLNPFAAPKYVFTRQDFAKARNR